MHCFCAVSCDWCSVRHACRFEETNSCFQQHSSHTRAYTENWRDLTEFHSPFNVRLVYVAERKWNALIGFRVERYRNRNGHFPLLPHQ